MAYRLTRAICGPHSIDDASDAGSSNTEFNLPQDIYAYDLAAEKTDSSFDHRNRFVGNVVYNLPLRAERMAEFVRLPRRRV